jgi:cobalt-zinc-cadmium efflux system membrane fusion protein
MKPIVHFFIGFLLLLMLPSCQKGKNASEAGVPADSAGIISNSLVRVTRDQFVQSGMQFGGLSNFNAAEIIISNGYIDVPTENRSKISTFLGGYVTIAGLLPGDRVYRGQVLASLENIEYLKLQQSFLEAREKLVYLKSIYEAQAALTQENFSSRRNYQQAQSDYLTMQANYESLAKQLQLIHIDPNSVKAENMETSIRLQSPFDGYITEINVVNGMFVNPSDVICEVINIDHMHLEMKVFEKDVLKLKKGQAVEFRVPETSPGSYQGEIILIGKAVEGNERTIPVHAHIHHEQSLNLIPGMYVEARIKTRERLLRGLPTEALLKGDGKDYVLVEKSEDGNQITLEKVSVDVGEVFEDWFEVRNSVALEQAGRQILIKGVFNLE